MMQSSNSIRAVHLLLPAALVALACFVALPSFTEEGVGEGVGEGLERSPEPKDSAPTPQTRARAHAAFSPRSERSGTLEQRTAGWLDAVAHPRPELERDTSPPESELEDITRLADADLSRPEVREVIGERNAVSVAEALNEVVLPETRDCLRAAHERAPDLAGQLALSFELAASEEGSTIREMSPLDTNEVRDAELLECIRGSLEAATFPAPVGPEPERLALSFPVAPAAG